MKDSNVIKGALIFAIILIVIEGVFLYIYHDSAKRREEDRAKATRDATEQRDKFEAAQAKVLKLTSFITGEESDPQIDGEDGLRAIYEKDKMKYSSGGGEGYRYFLEDLEGANKTRHREMMGDGNKGWSELIALQDRYQNLRAQYDVLVKNAEDATKDAEKKATDAATGYARRIGEIEKEVKSVEKGFEDTVADKDRELAYAVAEATQKTGEAVTNLSTVVEQRKQLTHLTRVSFDRPLGIINSVNQRSKTVIINLGSNDFLQTRMTFTVYPPSITGISFLPNESDNHSSICDVCKRERSLNASKASIEVTKILGPHRSEARILDDILTDPVVAGDVIYTPIWKPGEGQRFALGAGMKIPGVGSRDGTHFQSDLEMIISLIRMNGGFVDAYISEIEDEENGLKRGKTEGKITRFTNFLVIGDLSTDDDRDRDLMQAQRQMQQEAEILGSVRTIGLKELLTRMGWTPVTPVRGFGEFATDSDYHRFSPRRGSPSFSGANAVRDATAVEPVVSPRSGSPSSSGTVSPLFIPDNYEALVSNKDREVPSSPGTVSETYGTGRTPAISSGTVNELFNPRQPGAASSGVK